MKTFRFVTIFVLTLCLSLNLAPSSAGAKKKVKLNKTKLTLTEGKSYTLKLKNNKKKVKWTSTKKNVATVTAKGKVKAKKAGKTTITAKVSGKKYKCRVTVKEKTKSTPSTPDNNNGFTTTMKTDYAASFNILKNYILSYGVTNSSGDKAINSTYSYNGTNLVYGIVYSSTAQCFNFILVSDLELDYDEQASAGLCLSVTEASIANGAARFLIVYDSGYYGSVNGSFPLSSIHSGSNSFSWNTEEANITNTGEIADTSVTLAYACWTKLLQDHSLMPLTDLGFGA